MIIPLERLTQRSESGKAEFIVHAVDTADYFIYGNSVAEKLAFYEEAEEQRRLFIFSNSNAFEVLQNVVDVLNKYIADEENK